MKKKGFTLLEIIISISLITIISVMSLVLFNKKEINNEDKEILSSADVYIETNKISKLIYEQNDEIYLEINDLFNEGLINEKIKEKYENKCIYLNKEKPNFELTDDCKKLPYMKVSSEIQTNPDFEFVSNNGTYCSNSVDGLPKLSVNYHLNDATSADVIVKVNGELRDIHNGEYQTQFGDKNIEFIIKYSIGEGENKKEKEAIFKDNGEYLENKNPELFLEDNILKVSDTNKIFKKTETSTDYIETNIDSLNNEIKNTTNNEFYLRVTNKCNNEKEYKITKTEEVELLRHTKFTTQGGKCTDLSHNLLYVFPNGSILYETTHNSNQNLCGIGKYKGLYIYNPIKNQTITVKETSYSTSSSQDVKITKNSDGTFNIYRYIEKKDYNYKHSIYNSFVFNEDDWILEEKSHNELIIGSTVVYSTKKNYCKYNYYFNNNGINTYNYLVTSESLSGATSVYIDDNNGDCLYKNHLSLLRSTIENKNSEYKNAKNSFNTVVNYSDIEYNVTDVDIINYFREREGYGSTLITEKSNKIKELLSFERGSVYARTSDGNFSLVQNMVWKPNINETIVVVPFNERGENFSFAFIKYKINENIELNEINL